MRLLGDFRDDLNLIFLFFFLPFILLRQHILIACYHLICDFFPVLFLRNLLLLELLV